MIPKEFITKLKESTNIVELAKEHLDIHLSQAGAVYKALCPFPDHNERTPSFVIDPEKQNFVCYGGCGRNGDVLELTMELQSFTFIEAIKYLANLAEIPVPDDNGVHKKSRDTAPLLEILAAARDFYVSQSHTAVTKFIQDRDLNEEYLRTEWEVGYAPPKQLLPHLKSLGYSDKDIIDTGLLRENQERNQTYEAFRGRMMWTIYDNLNRPVGFGARKLFEKDPVEGKFINTSTTPLYKKSELFFGLNKSRAGIRKNRIAIMCEGYTDVVSFHLADLPYSLAPCGTSVTEHQVKRVSRLLGENGELVIAMDGDAAGIKSAVKILHLASIYPLTLSAIILPNKMDPDEYRQKFGVDKLREAFEARKPLVEELLEHTLAKHDLAHPEGVSQAAIDAGEVLSNVHNPVLRSEYNKWLSYQLKISRQNIENMYEEKKVSSNTYSKETRNLELNVLRLAYQKPELFKVYQESICSRTDLFRTVAIQESLDEMLWLDSDVSDGEWKENLIQVLDDKIVPYIKGGLPHNVIESDRVAGEYFEQLIARLEDDKRKSQERYTLKQEVFKNAQSSGDIFDQLTTLVSQEGEPA